MAESRKSPRAGTKQKCTAIVSGATAIDCMIRDISETGARLMFQHPTILPRTFRLQFDDQDQRVTVMWRRGLQAGVRFQAPIRTNIPRKRRSWFWSRS